MEARLVKALQSTIQDLDDVWREIGFSAKERSEQTELLFVEVTALFTQKIEQEKVLLDTYLDNVEEMREKIVMCCDRLDIPLPPQILQEQQESVSLVLRLSRLKQEHTALDAKRIEMEQLIGNKINELKQYGMEMKEPITIELQELKLTMDNFNTVTHQCGLAKHERDKRVEILETGRARVFDLLECLELDSTAQNQVDEWVRNHVEMDLSRNTLAVLQARAEELEDMKHKQSEQFLALFAEIRPLWDKLGVTQLEQDAFFARQGTSLGNRAMQACKVEISRLREIFKTKLVSFIDNIRVEIAAKLEELVPVSNELRERVGLMLAERVNATDFDSAEHLLLQHEHLLQEVDKQLEQLKPIQNGVQRYIALCEERTQYELLIQDSSRLLSRNKRNSGLPSLQEEEKMRQRVAQIPKYVSNLKQLIVDYEQKMCMGDGQRIRVGCKELCDGVCSNTIEALDRSEGEHDEKILRERQLRKQQQQQQQPTGGNMAGRRTSGSVPSQRTKQ